MSELSVVTDRPAASGATPVVTDANAKAKAQAQAAETQAPAVPAPEAVFRLRVADAAGVDLQPDPDLAAAPSDRLARVLVFDVQIAKGGASPTADDMALYREISRIEHALTELYPAGRAGAELRFRPFFVRLFHIAQLALEGDVKVDKAGRVISVGGRLSAAAAKAEVQAIADELVEDEAPRIKHLTLRSLTRGAVWAGGPALLAYAVISLLAPDATSQNLFTDALARLHVNPVTAANFMLLWTGTMVGVCLSYAFRTTPFTLADLTRTPGSDLSASQRLLFTGTLAVILVLMAMLQLGNVTLGEVSVAKAAELPMMAFVVGAVLGMGEKTLSKTVATRAGQLFGDGK